MTGKEEGVERHPKGRSVVIGLALAATFALGACSSVPDALNPAEWWRSASDLVSGDEREGAVPPSERPIPGESESFPKLGTVPDADAARARRPEARGLVGDTSTSRYGEPVTRQGAPANPLSAPAAPATPEVPVVPPAPTSERATDTLQASGGVEPPRMPEPPTASAPPAAAALTPASVAAPPQVLAERTIPPALPTPVAVAAPTAPFAVPAATMAAPSDATVVVSSDGISFEESGGRAAVMPAMGAGAPGAGAVRVATIQFGNGSAIIDERDQAVLRQVAAIVNQRGGRKVTIVGHASSRTRNLTPAQHIAVNEEMSVQRADAVAKALAGLGVRSDMIETRAASDQQPIFYEVMPSGEAGNRRTEVYIEF